MLTLEQKLIRAKLWIEALRSGEYPQGRNELKTDEDQPEYCCLGVYCELFSPKDLIPHAALPSKEIREEIESLMVTPNAFFNIVSHLTYLNDAGSSFLFIADVIEKEIFTEDQPNEC